ncbi:MAG: T9SS type A sorting domain-containing protein, partial [Chitinophagaceae bacterium]|nr:T9SS type A sorting domain-containing protein [Chitinophagaceae bacterium]
SSNKVQWVYTPSEFTPALPAGKITHIYLRTANSQGLTRSFDSLRISFKTVSYSTFPSATFESGATLIYGPKNTSIAIPSSGWFGVELENPIQYDGLSNFIVEFTITNTNSTTIAQNTGNGTKRIWGGRWSASGSSGTGHVACGFEVQTCPVDITSHPTNAAICAGANTSMSVVANNTNGYQWQISNNSGVSWSNVSNGGLYSGANSATLSITNATPGMGGYRYRCIATNSGSSCSLESNYGELILTPTSPSSIFILPSDTVICKGQSVTMLTAFSKGGSNPTYQWVKNGVDIPGATLSSYTTNSLQNNDNISVKFTSSQACVLPSASGNLVFSVGEKQEAKVNITTTYLGDNQYQFQAHPINGGKAPLYQWFKNGKYIPGATGARYVAENIFTSDRIHVEMVTSDECTKNKVAYSKSIGLDVNNVSNNDASFSIFPNPNSGTFTIKGDMKGSSAKFATVEIINALGQRVHTHQASLNNGAIDADISMDGNMPNGLYTVRISAEGVVGDVRFMLSR